MSRIRVVISDVLRHALCPPLWTCAEGIVWAMSVLVWEWGGCTQEHVWTCEWDARGVHRSRERWEGEPP